MSNQIDINIDSDDTVGKISDVVDSIPSTTDLVFLVCRLPNSDGTNDYYITSTHGIDEVHAALIETNFDWPS